METFEQVAIEWFEVNHAKWRQKYAEALWKRVESPALSSFKMMDITTINVKNILAIIRGIESKGKYSQARDLFLLINKVMRYALITGRIERNPAHGLSEALTKRKRRHYPSLHIKNMPEFIKQVDNASIEKSTKNAIYLLMLTFVRTNELVKTKWSEIDFENQMIEIPADRMKMKREHLVPLSDWAIAILQDQKQATGDSEWVFPGRSKKKPMSNCTILMSFFRMGYSKKMTGHGFRSLAMTTIKEKLGYRHEIIDRQLAHANNRAYDRADFLQDRKKMMQDWADYIKSNLMC